MVNALLPKFQVPGPIDFLPVSNALSENRLMSMKREQMAADEARQNEMMGLRRAQIAASLAPKPTALQKNYEAAKAQGFQGGLMDYQLALKKAGASVNNVNVDASKSDTFADKYDANLAKKASDRFDQIMQAGSKANVDLGNLKAAEAALDDPNLYMGSGGEFFQGLKKTAGTLFGIPVEGVPSGEVLQRLSAEASLALKDKLPGPMSDSDLKFLRSIPANLSTSPEGNRRVIKLGMASQLWRIELAKKAMEVARQNNGRLTPEGYAALSEIDAKWANEMGSLTRELMQMADQAPMRSPTAGFPDDPLGLRTKSE